MSTFNEIHESLEVALQVQFASTLTVCVSVPPPKVREILSMVSFAEAPDWLQDKARLKSHSGREDCKYYQCDDLLNDFELHQ